MSNEKETPKKEFTQEEMKDRMNEEHAEQRRENEADSHAQR